MEFARESITLAKVVQVQSKVFLTYKTNKKVIKLTLLQRFSPSNIGDVVNPARSEKQWLSMSNIGDVVNPVRSEFFDKKIVKEERGRDDKVGHTLVVWWWFGQSSLVTTFREV